MMPPSALQPCIALIDSGNTRIKAGWLDPASGAREEAALAITPHDMAELAAWYARQGRRPILAMAVNVAGAQRASQLTACFQDTFACPVHWLGSQRTAAGVHNHYSPPEQLGADRWLSMIGLAQQPSEQDTAANPRQPRLLASFGTATTVDTLYPATLVPGGRPDTPDSARGKSGVGVQPGIAGVMDLPATDWVYAGGLIFPGPELMRSSLASHTAQLPHAQGAAQAFPVNTRQAIASGIAAAQAGAVVRQWLMCLDLLGQPPHVYCTGGGWPGIRPEVDAAMARVQRLQGAPVQAIRSLASPILDGLAHMARTDLRNHLPDRQNWSGTRP